jgi:hypothetical protein
VESFGIFGITGMLTSRRVEYARQAINIITLVNARLILSICERENSRLEIRYIET